MQFLKEQIENFQDRFGDVTNPDEVAKGDIMYGRIHEVDGDGNVVDQRFGVQSEDALREILDGLVGS